MKAINYTAIAATVLCIAAGGVQAQESAGFSRAQVAAELAAARADGTLGALHGEDSGSFHFSQHQQPSGATRADVGAELAAARRSGELSGLHGEDSGSFMLSHQAGLAAAQARRQAAATLIAGSEGE